MEYSDKYLHQLMENSKGSATAVEFVDENGKCVSLTYEKIRQISDEISEDLNILRYGIVGIFSDQNEMLPVLLLSVLKQNCYFVYLPAQESDSYLKEWCSNLGISIILSYEKNWERPFAGLGYKLLHTVHNVNIIRSHVYLCKCKLNYDLNLFAYVMRTSGTTGRFKTVYVPHRAIVPNIVHLKELWNVTDEDVLFLSSPLTFDPSIVEIFLSLYAGAKLLIVSERLKATPEKLAAVLFDKFKVTVLQTTPSLLTRFGNSLLSEKILSESSVLRVLVLGGEKFPAQTIERNLHMNNKTRIFNIYGITEVSCWASCTEVDRSMLSKGEVPLGSVLLKTEFLTVKQRKDAKYFPNQDDDDDVIYELSVGGKERKCLVGDLETFVNAPDFRSTGDLVKIGKDEELYFVGRTDGQAKRFGKKFSVEGLEAMISECKSIDKASVLFVDECLCAFLEVNSSRDDENLLLNDVRAYVDTHCPNYCKPDRYIILMEFPLTEHGKIDKAVLLKILESTDSSGYFPVVCSEKSVFEKILYFAKDILGERESDLIKPDSFLWNLGFDSLKALQLVLKLETWFAKRLPMAYEIILFKTVQNLCEYLNENFTKTNADQLSSVKRPTSPVTEKPLKKRKTDSDSNHSDFCVIQKDGFRFENESLSFLTNAKVDKNRFQLNKEWKWDSGKCIDASPLLIWHFNISSCLVFIGSHSGVFAYLDARTGAVEWDVKLGGRIEATAAISECGNYAIIGCYDFSVYFIRINEVCTGDDDMIHWKFTTGDIVKCTACVCQHNKRVVFIGSHDGFIYALNYLEKVEKWKVNLSSAIVSQPCVDESGKFLFVAALNGSINCLTSDSGTVLWTVNVGKPVFSGLTTHNDNLFVGCVDGVLYFIHCQNGEITNTLSTLAPIFNGPSNTVSLEDDFEKARLIFGNFDGRISCCDLNANLIWNAFVNGPVTSSPYLFRAYLGRGKKQVEKRCCSLCTKKGTIYILDVENGSVLNEFQMPGESFSTPVVWDKFLFVGCRDNNLYCFNLC